MVGLLECYLKSKGGVKVEGKKRVIIEYWSEGKGCWSRYESVTSTEGKEEIKKLKKVFGDIEIRQVFLSKPYHY